MNTVSLKVLRSAAIVAEAWRIIGKPHIGNADYFSIRRPLGSDVAPEETVGLRPFW